jgi:hypothetical protein
MLVLYNIDILMALIILAIIIFCSCVVCLIAVRFLPGADDRD